MRVQLRGGFQNTGSQADEGSAAPGGARTTLLLAATWLACTLFLFFARSGYLFSASHSLDSWIYSAYQWDVRGQMAEFGPTYYGSRLSWIVPGAILHHFLPPAAANLCLKLILSAAFAAACAAIVRRTLGLRAAILAVGLAVLTPQVVVSLHSDYINIPVIIYGTLALACVTVACDSRRWWAWIFAAGLFFTGMVVANLSSLLMPGLGIAGFHLAWLRWGFRRQLGCIALYVLAGAVVILGLGLVSLRLGGNFYFLRPQVEMLTYVKGLENSPWMPGNWRWLPLATWLAIPAGALAWGVLTCCQSTAVLAGEARRLILALTAGLFASLAVALAIELKLNGVLYYEFYASYHLCLAIPLLAAITMGGGGTSTKPSLVLLFGFLLLFLSPAMATRFTTAAGETENLTHFSNPWLAVGVVAGLGLLALLAGSRMQWRRWLRPELPLLLIVFHSISIGFLYPRVTDRLRERYRMVYAANRVLDQTFAKGSYRFWYNPAEVSGVSLASTKLWQYRLVTMRQFPDIEPGLYSDKVIVVPCPIGRGQAALDLARQRLAPSRIELAEPRIITVPGESGLGFDLACFSMRWANADPEQSPETLARARRLLDLHHAAGNSYASSLERNLYGRDPGTALAVGKEYPTFTRTDPRDHLAVPFIALPEAGAGEARHVSLVVENAAPSPAVCIVQGGDFSELARFPLGAAGRSVHTFAVPAGIKKLRFYFQGETDAAVPLPVRITLYAIDP